MSEAAPALDSGFPSQAWLARLRARGTEPAFAHARTALDERVEGFHRVLPDIPRRQAGYYHEFFCPTHAVQLIFDPQAPHRHACPVDGVIFSGEPYDSAWGWSVNDALSDAALRASVRRSLGHANGRSAADADLIRHVLTGYAERYRTMPPAPRPYPNEYSGIACWSALDESVWIIRLVWAAALVGDALATGDARLLREGLFEPALEHLLRVRYRQIQNVGNWDCAAILSLGLLLADEGAVREAMDGEYGIRDQLTRGVTPDGLWWELSLSYHFYVLGAVAWTMRALRAAGTTFDKEAAVRSMFLAPLDLAFPDRSLPATNDCWYHIGLRGEVGHGIPNADGFYEMAYGWFGDPRFAWVIGRNRRAGTPRTTFEGLLDGAAELAEGTAPTVRSRHLAGSGLAMLRSGAGPGETALLLKASGDDGDAHGHPDQLGIALFGAGARIAIDPGTPGYGIRLNDTWYRQTAAHSTVLVDGRSQPPGHARITRFRELREATVVDAKIAWPKAAGWSAVTERARSVAWPDQDPHEGYGGVRMRRSLALGDGYLIDVVRFEAPGPRTVDWLLHLPPAAGAGQGVALEAACELRGPCGYDELTDVRTLGADDSTIVARIGEGAVAVHLVGTRAADTARFLASAPGNPAADRHSLLIRRRRVARTTFISLVVTAPAAVAATISESFGRWTIDVRTLGSHTRWRASGRGIAPIDRSDRAREVAR